MEIIDQYRFLFVTIGDFVFSVLITLTGFWQGLFLIGIIAGLSSTTKRNAIYSSMIGTIAAWLLITLYNIFANKSWILFTQVTEIFTGGDLSIVFYLVVLGIATLLGFLGGYLGFYFLQVIHQHRNKLDQQKSLKNTSLSEKTSE